MRTNPLRPKNLKSLARLATKGIAPIPWTTAESILTKCIRDPESFWGASGVRQAIKVLNARGPFSRAQNYTPAQVARKCLSTVEQMRKERQDKPVFIFGPGGCGTHWLGQMLGDLPRLYDGKSMHEPPTLSVLYDLFPGTEMANLIWAYLLLVTWGSGDPAQDFNGNMVISTIRPDAARFFRWKDIWPKARLIYLMRDPRDIVMSVTHRKKRYRAFVAPGIVDRDYLRQNCERLATDHLPFYEKIAEHVVMIKYEDLRADATASLHWILDRLAIAGTEDDVQNAVSRNDAGAMRRGNVGKRGNLDEGGVAKGWRKDMTDEERKVCKPILGGVVEAFGYGHPQDW